MTFFQNNDQVFFLLQLSNYQDGFSQKSSTQSKLLQQLERDGTRLGTELEDSSSSIPKHSLTALDTDQPIFQNPASIFATLISLYLQIHTQAFKKLPHFGQVQKDRAMDMAGHLLAFRCQDKTDLQIYKMDGFTWPQRLVNLVVPAGSTSSSTLSACINFFEVWINCLEC